MALILFCLCVSCENYPRDPEGTLKKTEGKILRVGITENPPFVLFEKEGPGGTEVQLIKAFAKDLNADIRWIKGSEATIFTLLKKGAIDIAAGGFRHQSVWKKHVHFTNPHDTIILKWGVPPGQDIPTQLKGKTIYVENGLAAGVAVEKQDARIVYLDTLQGHEPLVVAPAEELIKLKYNTSEDVLAEEKVSFAIQKGENAFLKRLEIFIKEYTSRKY